MIIPRSETRSFRTRIIAFLMDGCGWRATRRRLNHRECRDDLAHGATCNRLLPDTEGAVAYFRGVPICKPLGLSQGRLIDLLGVEFRPCCRHSQDHGRASPQDALDFDTSAALRGEMLHHRQAYTAQALALRGEKWLEGTGNGPRGHSDTSIGDAKLDKGWHGHERRRRRSRSSRRPALRHAR